MRNLDDLQGRLSDAEGIGFFLDYDGTLADFSPTPDIVEPVPAVIQLLEGLKAHPRLNLAVVSGRRLEHVEKLIPISGIILAGTYGIEIRWESGEREDRISFDTIRPVLNALKPEWQSLLPAGEGFHLEDKRWSLAIHGRFAETHKAETVLARARKVAEDLVNAEVFRILGGHKFLEVAPLQANKGKTLEFLLQKVDWARGLLLYIGDDDKDEEAFDVIKSYGGIPIVVAAEPRESRALYRMESPRQVRAWLASTLDLIQDQV